ncbi:MBL fold metallo-hydrolase [Ornithinimicrobium sp. F0845]|uniref:MBL fold metallo-hydrolase n=1 Tax=Ornithinimicrobium sp. F0845 TaxID=2926412 RepID=UPI001FF632D6|nr:MBL fold metallo-hydrolase [Ornithinimicrobium sp. F0845]
MLVIRIEAAAFGTNCYVVAPDDGEECVIVDPGVGVENQVAEVLAERHLRPAAVLLTHGHLDHTYAVAPVCAGRTAAYIHEEDRYRLQDPLASTSPALVAMLEQQFGRRATWAEPDTVIDLREGQVLDLAGLSLEVSHAPGHTEGSVLYGLAGVPTGMPDEVDRTVLTGDVLFAGSIGRTDLPGGDHATMLRSLRDVILPLPDSSLVLPGHGPGTTMARERATNPFLTGLT